MNFLIVEDDEFKRGRIKTFLSEVYKKANIEERASYQSGLEALIKLKFDIVILDMTMPIFDVSPAEDGGRPQPYAGKKILQQMKRKGIETPVVTVTQFDRFDEGNNTKTLAELNKELQKEFSGIYKGSVFYHASQDRWREQLKSIIDNNVKE